MEVIGVVVVLVIAAIIALSLRSAGKRRDALAGLARALGGHSFSNGAEGVFEGVATRLEFETRGSGSSSESWTYIHCQLPTGYPFTLHVAKHGWLDSNGSPRDGVADLQFGDEAFDKRYRVEGAPTDVVRRVLTPEARVYLLVEGNAELMTEDGRLRLAVRGWLEDWSKSGPALTCVARIAAAVRQATLSVEAETPMVQAADVYRGIPSDAPLQQARAARAAEVQHVEASLAGRAQRLKTLQVVIVVVFVIGALAAMSSMMGGP